MTNKRYTYLSIHFLMIFFCVFNFPFHEKIEGALVPLGLGAYTTDLPTDQKGPSDEAGNPVLPKVTSNFQLAPITNQWWSSLIWKHKASNPWSENLFAYPFSCRAITQGLGVCYASTYTISPYHLTDSGYNSHEYHYNYSQDLLVGVNGLSSADTKVSRYSDWTVTAEWSGNGRTMSALIGKGIPFIYFTLSGDNALISAGTTPTIWYNTNGVIGLTIKGRHYGIFGPSGSTWTGTTTLSSSLNGKNYLSIAVLPDNTPQTLEFYRQHAYAFVTNTSVSWNYDQTNAQLITTYNVQTTLQEPGNNNVNRPLLALFRHQWLNTSATFTPYTYVSPRGVMKVIDNASFTTSLTFNGVLPELPNVAIDGVDTYNKAQLYQYVDTIYKQDPVTRFNGINVGDTYWTGKALGRLARLVQIADQIGHIAARDLFVNDLKCRLEDWFDGQSNQLFYYDSNWRTLIGYPASYGSNTELSDHHFHYGYFIMAASTIAQYDPTWASESQWGSMVNLLIKDVSNWERLDNQFPFLRYHDIYEGHGWANGPALFGAGNNQESSSESMNFSAAVILWGALTNNSAIRDLGIYLYATETTAIEQYWFDKDGEVFPSEWKEPTIAIAWGNGGAYAIWWNGRIEEVHGINFLPITGGSLYLGRNPNYLQLNQTFMQANGGTTNDWIDIHMAVRSFYNPLNEIYLFNSNPNYTSEAGETKAHTYHWIHNLNTLGILDTAVTADQPIYAVFNKNDLKTYVAFNPKDSPLTVHFSDGYQLQVPPRQLASSSDMIDPTFVQGAEELEGGQVKIWFQSTPLSSSVSLTYKVNSGTQKTVNLTQTVSGWETILSEINTGDILTYDFSYIQNGMSNQTPTYQHTYTIDHGFTQSVIDKDSGQTLFSFQSNQPSSSVILTYQVNSGPLTTANMASNSTGWEYQIDELNNGDSITYSFTYIQNNMDYFTPYYTHTCQFEIPPDEFSHYVTPYAWGNAGISFIPNSSTTFVDVHYTINNTSQQNVRMKNQNGTWVSIVTELKANDVIKYWFTYSTSTGVADSTSFQFTYQPSATPPPPNGPYTQAVNHLCNGRASFTFMPNNQADWVIVHYNVNNTGQFNVQMTNNNCSFDYVINGIKGGDVIDYWYTYSINGSSSDSVRYQHVY